MSRKSSPFRKKAFCQKKVCCPTAEIAQPVIWHLGKFWVQDLSFVFALSSVNEVVWLESHLAYVVLSFDITLEGNYSLKKLVDQ